jgi:outer membrane receptor protein involved in Fe transport
MLEKSGAAFSRVARWALAVVALSLGASGLWAQGTTGKIEGSVVDATGSPVAGAQVVIVGTAAGAVSADNGYFFINNVPAGVYTLRAQFIGYQPSEVRNVRVLADQTLTVNFTMARAVELGAITVTVQQNPIVPRDQVTSKSIITGNLVNELPVDNVRDVLSLQPGVVESGKGEGLSLRGGRPGEAVVMVDGAPVRSALTGADRLTVGTNALEEASITTGAIGAEFGDAQSGIISYVTKSGGPKLNGSIAYQTDEPFGNGMSVGFNTVEASLGGPIAGNLTFFLSGQLFGQQSSFQGKGFETTPTWVLGGLDTTVTVAGTSGETAVDIPRFIQYSGECNAADNYGFACQGRRLPYDWNSSLASQAKLQYTYGSGSQVSLTGLYSQTQNRNWNGGFAYQRSSGTRNWSNAVTLNWTQQVARSAERALAFDVNLSYQNDYSINGAFTRDYEVSNRDPFGGFGLSPMKFIVDFDHFSDADPADPLSVRSLKSQADWDLLVNNIRTNQGTRVPYLDRDDLRNAQPYRMNPWALATGFSNSGLDVNSILYQEHRYIGRANVDWQADRFNRFKFGGDAQVTRMNYFNSGILRQTFMEAETENPVRYGAYAQDRLDLGDVVVELGIRWDYFDTRAYLPVVPGRIFTNPNFDPADPLNPADSVFARVQSHTAWSPRVRVSFPVTDKTGFRLSYSHQVQMPGMRDMLQGFNNDLSFTNTNDIFGRDVTWGKTILFEFGIRHAFSQDLVLDLSAYNKDKVSDLSTRIQPFFDPLQQRIQNINVLTNLDFGNVRGVDVNIIRRIGDFFNGTLSYTFQVAKNTGSDPFSYINTTSRQISGVTGERVDPPQAILPTNDNRTHNIAGSLSFNFPGDFAQGTWYGSILKNGGAFLRFRFVSGLPYTRLVNAGNGQTAPFVAFGLSGQQAEPINSSTMPWTKQLDLRLTKGVVFHGTEWTLFADIRNLLNLTTITSLFAETGDVVNPLHREHTVDPEVARLEGEAASFLTTITSGGETISAIMLPTDCNDWGNGPVNCVLLKRAEARYGNGDGVYDENEYRAAFNAEYDTFNNPSFRYADPRSIRLGFELRF